MNVRTELTADVLVLGAGRCADRVVSNLNNHRLSVVVATPDGETAADLSGDLLTALPRTRVNHAAGGPGAFQVRLENGDRRINAAVKQIVVAEGHTTVPRFKSYGLVPGKRVRSLSEVMSPDADGAAGRVAFLVGLVTDNNTVATRQAMSAALALHNRGKGTAYILTRNLKVADDGLEALYRETKTAGVTYIKFTDTVPVVEQSGNDKITISFGDETTRESFRLTPDLVVVDEDMRPAPYLSILGERFKLHKDAAGFLQKENVHREGVLTNRRGIYVIGPARGVFTPNAQMADADDAALRIDGFLRGLEGPRPAAAEINRGQCVKCLTCYRLCPYGAIHLETRPVVMPAACESCGLCTAECPKEAIRLAPLELAQIKSRMAAPAEAGDALKIIAFCCNRSAAQAYRAAAAMEADLPAGLAVIDVPCAGGIALQHILAAFEKQADGVLVLTCHMDNCHSENGNRFARTRVTELKGVLSTIGIGAERLAFHTLASNMATEFSKIVTAFEAVLDQLEPVRHVQA